MFRIICCGVAGFILWGMFSGSRYILTGFFLGLAFGFILDLRNRILAIEKRIKALDAPVKDKRADAPAYPAPEASREKEEQPVPRKKAASPMPSREIAAEEEVLSEKGMSPVSEAHEEPVPSLSLEKEMPKPPPLPNKKEDLKRPKEQKTSFSGASPHRKKTIVLPEEAEPRQSFGEEITGKIREMISKMNPVVQLGVLILLIGVGFLVKYAVDHNFFPLEFRLFLAGLGGIVLIVTGLRLRPKKPDYAVMIQAAGVGVLYLTLYGSAMLYHLIPPLFALVLMIAIVGFSGMLSVLQNAMWFAVLAAAGGFLAPVLTSTGKGEHVLLFSYYLLLNAGILGISWFRAWRVLNIVGFVFTFVIGSLWGYRYYSPDYFASVEPFLIAFFLFYVGISILFAQKSPPNLKGYVDGTLVFGTPLIVFGLQYALVKNFEYGLAFSAFFFSFFYIALSFFLWKRTDLRMLTEAFLALGVVFGTLALPLALDDKWSSASWAMEGAAIVWIGVRQKRWMARNFGLVLQAGSGFFFLKGWQDHADAIPVINGNCLGMILIGFAGLFSGYYLMRNQDTLKEWEKPFHVFAMIWGLIWAYMAGVMEIRYQLPNDFVPSAMIIFTSLFFLGSTFASFRLSWKEMQVPPGLLFPFLAMISLYHLGNIGTNHPFGDLGWIAWPLGIGGWYYILYRLEKKWPSAISTAGHVGGAWLFVFILTLEAAWQVHNIATKDHEWWAWLTIGILPALSVFLLLQFRQRPTWPFTDFPGAYYTISACGIWFFLFAWELISCFLPSSPSPVFFLPVLNPIDMCQVFVLIVMGLWILSCHRGKGEEGSFSYVNLLLYCIIIACFSWVNACAARAVSEWADIPYRLPRLIRAGEFHTTISFLWTTISLATMAAASAKGHRKAWFFGAFLIGAVILKLFVYDLDSMGARIVSFTGVGVLLLVVGYISPLPPEKEKQT